tara:strand:- start:359 stop:787 length:429 start_codon:yes stop_codon:yes gene_type:complete
MNIQEIFAKMADNAKPDKNGDIFNSGHVMHNIHFDGAPILIVEDYILGAVLHHPSRFTLAPRTHEVNGFTVPAPLTEPPAKGFNYFTPVIAHDEFFGATNWDGYPLDLRFLSRGLCFTTKEAAQQNALAMLGRDPAKGVEGA